MLKAKCLYCRRCGTKIERYVELPAQNNGLVVEVSEKLLMSEDVATILGVTSVSVTRWARLGLLKGHHNGQRSPWRFDSYYVKSFVEDRRKPKKLVRRTYCLDCWSVVLHEHGKCIGREGGLLASIRKRANGLYVDLTYNLKADSVKCQSNIKDHLMSDLLLDFLRTQIGKGADESPPADRKNYHVRLGLDLSNDSWTVQYDDCGNLGLRDGIIGRCSILLENRLVVEEDEVILVPDTTVMRRFDFT